MGRAPCCEKVGLKRGRWTAEEDEILLKYIQANGEGSWRSLPKNAGLMRCGKSCRLRWINYLRTDLKRGNISPEEEQIIIKLHSSFGNRWSLIAGHLPGRTDNEIKNYWNSHLSRRILRVRRPGVLLPDVVLDIGKIAAGHGCKKRSAGRTRRSAMKKNKAYGEMRRSGILLHARAPGSFSTTVEKAALLKDAHHVPVLGVENDQVALLVPGHEEKIINDHHHHVLGPVLIHEKEAAEINDEGMKSWEMGCTEKKGEKGSSTEINNGLFFSVDQVIMETEVTTGYSADQERESTSTGFLGSNELDSELSGGLLTVLLKEERENGVVMGANHEDQWFESDHLKDNINEWCNSSNLDVDSFDQEMGYNILQDDEWLDWKWPDGVVEDMMVLLREEEDGGPETTWSWLWESDNEEGQQCLAIGHEQEEKYAAWLLSADTNNNEL